MLRQNMLALLAAAFTCLAPSVGAMADELLKFRLVLHSTFAQSQDVGDVNGHVVTVVRFSGLASFPDGTVGTASYVGMFDYIKGAGPWSVYQNVTFEDGSALWYKGAGTVVPEGTKTLINGTLSVIGGKGQFDGAKGDGMVIGARLTPLSVGADLYTDVTINLKK